MSSAGIPFPLPTALPGAVKSVATPAPTTTFQVGTYNSTNDAFTLTLDLNDFVTFWIEWKMMKMPQPEKVFSRSFNIRTPGENIFKYQYKNRHIQVSVRLKNTTTATILQSVRALLAAIENPPYTLRIRLPNGTQYSYADVVAVKHNIPTDPQSLLALVIPSIQLDFECKPGLRGDRVVLSNLCMNPGFEAPMGGGVAQTSIQVFADNFANGNAYTTITGSPTVASNELSLPINASVTFGSPSWSAFYSWVVRFAAATAGIASFYLHYADANNFTRLDISGTTYTLFQVIAGVSHTVTSGSSATPVNTFYWAFISQYPVQVGQAPTVSFTIYADSGGAIGASIYTVGPVAIFSYNTGGVSGKMGFLAQGATVNFGNITANSNVVSLFGPGGWSFASAGTGQAAGSWEGELSRGASAQTQNTFPGGPVTSLGAGRIDLAPAGNVNASWFSGYGGGSPTGTTAIPIATPSDLIWMAAQVKSLGLGASATINLYVDTFNAAGTLLASTAVATLTGNQTNWIQMIGSLITPLAAYLRVRINVSDGTSGSAGATVWIDNIQCWDQTSTGMASMPYCELRYPNSPGQLMTSGLLGDMPAPAVVEAALFTSAFNTGHNVFAWMGRRALATPNLRMVGATTGGADVTDVASYGGYKLAANLGPLIYSSQNETGIYHVLGRAQTANASPTVVSINAQIIMIQVPIGGAPTAAGAIDPQVATWLGASIFPFTAQNTWTTCDIGQVALPPSPLGSLVNPAQVAGYVSSNSGGAGGSQLTVNYVALLPVDGELFTATVNNNANISNNIANKWVYLYWDGVAGVTTYSVENNAIPNPVLAVSDPTGTGPISVATGNPMLIVNANADTMPQVDPTIGTPNARGVNQYLLHLADDASSVLAIACDIVYSPLYLYPR